MITVLVLLAVLAAASLATSEYMISLWQMTSQKASTTNHLGDTHD